MVCTLSSLWSRLAVLDLIKERRDATLLFLSSLLKLETTPFTQNDHYLSSKTAASLARFKEARAGKATPERVRPVKVEHKDSNASSSGLQSFPESEFLATRILIGRLLTDTV